MSTPSVPASAPVLVTGATGRQGGATARALLAAGIPVRAVVRYPDSERAKAVEALGVELVQGDLYDRDSVIRAAEGTRGVFSVQMPDVTSDRPFAGEVAQAVSLIEGALAAGVPQFVHTSVSGAGDHARTPGWAEGRWDFMAPYYAAKTEIQDRVRTAGFAHWTLIKPGFFMENFLPSMAYLLPRGIEGGIVTSIHPHTQLSLVAVDDIGRAAAAAFADPGRFDEVELELAGDRLTMTQVAAILARATGADLTAPDMTEAEAFAAGMPPMGASHEWMNVRDQPARPEFAQGLGIPVTSFADWSNQYMRP